MDKRKAEKLKIMDNYEDCAIENASRDRMDCFEEVFYAEISQFYHYIF